MPPAKKSDSPERGSRSNLVQPTRGRKYFQKNQYIALLQLLPNKYFRGMKLIDRGMKLKLIGQQSAAALIGSN